MSGARTAATGDAPQLTWEAPGRGDWRGLHDHFPRALTAEYRLLLAAAMEDGEAIWFAEYGLPARTIVPAFVHGRVFINAAPLISWAPTAMPPAPVMKVLVRLAPPFRRRAKAAARTLDRRSWLAEAARWWETERIEWRQANEHIDAVDPGQLTDDKLLSHLHTVRQHARAGYLAHFRLHGTDLIPTALFLTRAGEWGIDPVDAVALLAGSSPASRAAEPLPPWRLVTGYDLDERCATELPELPLSDRVAPPPDLGLEGEMRRRVPAEHHDEWDLRLADARATYGVRDDNGMLTGAWPVGLLRRAMLEVGRRLTARGQFSDPALAVELTVDELTAAFNGEDPPFAENSFGEEATDRLYERRRLSWTPAPLTLGLPVDLPLQVLPTPMRLITRALLSSRELLTSTPEERAALTGVGIGSEIVVGRALVAAEPAEALARFQPGDIIVTRGTTPAWNALLSLAGGVVTEEGGPLSHAAIIARELALPAVIGTADALDLVPDGAQVELDPISGRVHILDAA